MFIKILIWALNKVFNGINREKLEPCIKELYRRMAQDNLKIRTEIVKVKKGKNRYDVAFFETPGGVTRLNLDRNWENNSVIELKNQKAYTVADAINMLEHS